MKITLIHTAGATCSNYTPFASIFFVVESAFIGINSSVGKTRQLKTSCLGLSSRFLFEKVWVTQGLPCIIPGVALDKTPNTRKWKFTIGQKPDLIRFFGERRQLLVRTTREETRQLGRTSRKRLSTSLPYSSHPYFSRFENSKAFNKETRKEKKKKQHRLKHKRARNNFGSISATNVNAHNLVTTPDRARKVLSQITCFNYIEKGHYLRNCSELKRDGVEE